MPTPPHNVDRLVVILSDIEMGAGGVLDDFPHPDFLAALIGSYTAPPYEDIAVDLVLNGDTFDLLKTSLDGQYPRRVTESVALAKLERVVAAHRSFFVALRDFLSHSGAPRRVHFIIGNHDLELVFAAVQLRIRREIGREQVYFPGLSMRIGELYIEHGMQADPMFTVDPARLFHTHNGEVVLALPWGSMAIIDVALPLQPLLYDLDRLKPRDRVLSLLPEVQELLVGAYWTYWTHDWWRDFFSSKSPSQHISWTMLKEVAYRFRTRSATLTHSDHYRRMATESEEVKVVMIGHLHQPSWWSWCDRKLLQTGCLRDEFLVNPDGSVCPDALLKVYAHAWLRGDRVVKAELVEVEGPPPPQGHIIGHVQAVLPRIQPLLKPDEHRDKVSSAQQAQEAREARQRRRS